MGGSQFREPPIFFFSSSFSSIFSQKPWKLRGKVVSLHKKSCTRQIESKLSLRSFAFSLQKKSCTRQIENKLSLRSFAFSLPPNSLKKIFRLCKTWVKDNESVWICEICGSFLCPTDFTDLHRFFMPWASSFSLYLSAVVQCEVFLLIPLSVYQRRL